MSQNLSPSNETNEKGSIETIDDDEKEPLTRKELYGWYLYNFACGVYDVAVIGFFIPVVLENLAGKAGYELDHVTPCNTSIVNHKCIVRFGTGYVDTQAYSLYIVALSVLFQCFVFIGSSSLADHGAYRKLFLFFYSFIGAIATSLFAAILKAGNQNEWYWMAGILAIISNCCYGAAFVFYLAYIPIYSRINSEVLSLKATNPPEEELLKAQNKFATDISQKTTSIGFVAGLLVIFGGLGIVIAIGTNNSDFGLQYSISFGGGWWLVWSIIPLFLLKKHPRPPLPSTENKFLYPYKRTFKTIRSASKLWQTMKFLISWFFLSDGINTIGPLAALFGQTTFNLTDTELIIIAIVVPLTAAIGIFIFSFIERFFGLKTRTMILINSFLLALLPIYVLIGFIAPFGLKQKWEVWLFVIYFGLSLGSVQAYCQAMFSYLIPKGHENEFFSLYLITAKGSSWLGPLATGAITDYTHQIRSGFWFLVFSLLIPCIIILTVDVDKGKDDAEKFAIMEREEKDQEQKL